MDDDDPLDGIEDDLPARQPDADHIWLLTEIASGRIESTADLRQRAQERLRELGVDPTPLDSK
jgi:hypothetical protein